MKSYKKLSTIVKKVESVTKDNAVFDSSHWIRDESTQTELRLRTSSTIDISVDEIKYPKNLRGETNPLWVNMRNIAHEINNVCNVYRHGHEHDEFINAKTKSGTAKRSAVKKAYAIAQGNIFLSACLSAKNEIKTHRKRISELQARQKALLPQLRRENSEYLSERKAEKADLARENAEALASGEFWNATTGALKDYFNPPFGKNYLADVSEKWRAALFLEVKSAGWKSHSGWRHKLTATGSAYLCGIDDNGDEWGHRVWIEDRLGINDHGDLSMGANVEDAMATLFDIPLTKVGGCHRQGDLLFCPTKIPTEYREWCRRCGAKREDHHIEDVSYWDDDLEIMVKHGEHIACYPDAPPYFGYDPTCQHPIELHHQETWDIMESHEVWSPGMLRNGHHIKSEREIVVSHTSHETVVLPPGEYRLYTLQVADAD